MRPNFGIIRRRKFFSVELSVPHEDNITSAHEQKEDRYKDLVNECKESEY